MFFRRRSSGILSKYDNNELAHTLLQEINKQKSVCVEVNIDSLKINGVTYWYSTYGYDWMTNSETEGFRNWLYENMTQKNNHECMYYIKSGGGGEFPVYVIVPKGTNPYKPLKKW